MSSRHGLTALYRSVGEELHHFDLDVEAASLTRRDTVRVPAGVQYVWPHPSRQYLYVASSSRGSGATGDMHHLTAFRVDDFPYEAVSHRMEPGDTLCLLTDGVTEAMSPVGELYGRQRLEAVLMSVPGAASVDALGDAIRRDVERFAAGVDAADDLAILVLRWTGASRPLHST